MPDKKDKELSEKDLKKATGGVDPRLQFKGGHTAQDDDPTRIGTSEAIRKKEAGAQKGTKINPM